MVQLIVSAAGTTAEALARMTAQRVGHSWSQREGTRSDDDGLCCWRMIGQTVWEDTMVMRKREFCYQISLVRVYQAELQPNTLEESHNSLGELPTATKVTVILFC
jgi:hypothetical protein